ncbi:hypothetical protein UY3_01660 [Chelonia mydas]|uniref:Uncharacterized protein n=1 Tax=Chelonia mydas TaxID=8469 RepID=M7C912_CHEMY|nr:hypothetical protein UY3_01660 [Chelonia mydas]
MPLGTSTETCKARFGLADLKKFASKADSFSPDPSPAGVTCSSDILVPLCSSADRRKSSVELDSLSLSPTDVDPIRDITSATLSP